MVFVSYGGARMAYIADQIEEEQIKKKRDETGRELNAFEKETELIRTMEDFILRLKNATWLYYITVFSCIFLNGAIILGGYILACQFI